MISVVLQLLKSKLAAYAAILVIILVLGIGGPMYFSQWKWEFRGAALLVLIVFLIYLAIKTYRERKKARMLEGFLQQQADDQVLSAQPDVQDELAAIKEKLNAAIGILKNSRLARGRRGSQALYVLPWYMIIGPSSAGKSTMLRNSGLQFPSVDSSTDEPARVKGLGGTRNCDWWLSSQGIFLDTAGRYTVSAEGGGGDDREEWSNFLAMLKKARGKAPINGLVLAVAIDEILREDDDGLEQLAKTLRRRIDELIVKLEILFPIYVVFTKCDLIAGFTEYCGDFRRREREQVWGYTRRYEQPKRPLHEEFTREVAALTTVLEHRRLRQLQAAVRPVQKRGTYLFPVEFGAAGRRLSRFVEILFQPNPYQQNPMVRGFYFNSGTQEGTPIAQVMAAMRRDFGLASDAPLPIEPVRETKAFFIKDLFQQVILPDESRVVPLTSAGKRRRLIRGAWNIAQAAAAVLLILAFLGSSFKNREFNRRLQIKTGNVDAVLQNASSLSLNELETLDELRERLEQAERGPGLWRRWGLYTGDVVIDSARAVYLSHYNRLFLKPLASSLRPPLRGTPLPDEMDSYFSKATVYQMVTLHVDSSSPAVEDLIAEAQGVWRNRIPESDQPQAWALIEDQAHYYWKQRRDDRELQRYAQLRVTPDPQLLAWINEKLGDYWTDRRLYVQIIREVNGELGFIGVEDLARAALRLSGGRVGGAFTLEGWEEHVGPRIKNVPDLIAANPLLDQAFENYDKDDLRAKLRGFYVDEFRSSWRSFLNSILIAPFADLADAGEALSEFSQENSPILIVLKKVYAHSQFGDLDSKEKRPIDNDFKPLGEFLGEGVPEGEKPGDVAYVELMVEILDDAETAMANLESMHKCHLRLKSLNKQFNKRRQRIARLAGASGGGVARAAADLLLQPLQLTQRAAIVDGCRCLDRVWKERIYEQYWMTLQNQYPFSRGSADDAPTGEVIALFSNKLPDFHRDEADPASDEGVPLSGAYLSAYSVARQIGSVVSGSRVRLDFILRADSKLLTGLREMRFQIGSKRFDYAMGPAREQAFQWHPGAGDLRLVVMAEDRALQARPRSVPGDWSMLRFFDEAKFEGRIASWAFPVGAGQNLYARYQLGGSDAGFITAGHFSQFTCPRTICR